MENKEVRHGHNHNQWKIRIAAGHMGVIGCINSQILTKVSCSLALPSPDNPFMRDIFLYIRVPCCL